MQVWVNDKLAFNSLVNVRDGWHYYEPPFDHVLVTDYTNPDTSPIERYTPFSQARFELRPANQDW